MQKIDTAEQLRHAIEALEKTQEAEADGVKMQMHEVYESVRPLNLIKSTFKEIEESPEIENTLLKIPVALVSGYVSNRLMKGPTQTSVGGVLGRAVVDTVADSIKKNPEMFNIVAKTAFGLLMNTLRSNKKREK